jgi:hypothetical protein
MAWWRVLVHIGEKIHFAFVFPTDSTGGCFHLAQKVSFLQLQYLWPKVCWHAISFVLKGTLAVYFSAV